MGINVSIKNRDIIIVDDLVSSGGTMIGAARIMKQLGAKSVSLAYVHGVHSIKNTNNRHYKIRYSRIRIH